MEEYSSSSSTITDLSKNPNEENGSNSKQSIPTYYSSLHSVKKAPSKPWNKKCSIAPLPPNPPRVYKVDPINFRDLVQKLTAAPEFLQTRRLHDIAPPSLQVASKPSLFNKSSINKITRTEHLEAKPSLSAMYKEFSEELDQTGKAQMNKGLSDNQVASNSLGLNLSPSSYNWCSFPLLSPDTCSFLEQSTFL